MPKVWKLTLVCRSICSDRTIAPLRVTPTLMSAILEKRSVRSEFLQVLLSFGDEPHQSEASNSYFFYAEPGENECKTCRVVALNAEVPC